MDKMKEETNSSKKKPLAKPRLLQGKVVSDKMDKTATVLVNRFKQHPKYKKRYLVSKKYKAQNEGNQYKTGDYVIIKENRPLSKDKKWVIVEKK